MSWVVWPTLVSVSSCLWCVAVCHKNPQRCLMSSTLLSVVLFGNEIHHCKWTRHWHSHCPMHSHILIVLSLQDREVGATTWTLFSSAVPTTSSTFTRHMGMKFTLHCNSLIWNHVYLTLAHMQRPDRPEPSSYSIQMRGEYSCKLMKLPGFSVFWCEQLHWWA